MSVYRRLEEKFQAGHCVVLDGGNATELERAGFITPEPYRTLKIWGSWALSHRPDEVRRIHRSYVETGCDVITTNTWALSDLAEAQEQGYVRPERPGSWLDLARVGLDCGRQAIEDGGRGDSCALAFSVAGDMTSRDDLERLELLIRVFKESPPDIIFLETAGLIRDGLTFPAVAKIVATGIPVWLSFRRCREGVCGVFGQLWGGPEGDTFGRAARKLEQIGVQALMFNCLPVWRLAGALPWLRDFVDLPLGVYPNLGHYLGSRWAFSTDTSPQNFAQMALEWRQEGAQIVGGCCGVTPDHISEVVEAVRGVKVGRLDRPAPSPPPSVRPWNDRWGRNLFPLPFPKIICEPGVFRPTQGSFLMWKHLFNHGLGKGQRCLEVGCGTGILAIQLALNGARSVEAMDIDQSAVQNTLVNAFRNGVHDRVTASCVDVYTYLPRHRFDLVVASLYQMPVDPQAETSSLRPADFWGRNPLDHLISLLPTLLEEQGVAYLMQISVLSRQQTEEQLSRHGLEARVVDFSFFYFSRVFYDHIDQIQRVTELSDAYKLTFGEDELMVMYLLEIRQASSK